MVAPAAASPPSSPGPSHLPSSRGGDGAAHDAAVESARLRLSAAEKWSRSSAALHEEAKSQAALSRDELRDARECAAGVVCADGSARLRVSAAERWVGSAAGLLRGTEFAVTLPQEVVRAAREYLERMVARPGRETMEEDGEDEYYANIGDIVIAASFSGKTKSEASPTKNEAASKAIESADDPQLWASSPGWTADSTLSEISGISSIDSKRNSRASGGKEARDLAVVAESNENEEKEICKENVDSQKDITKDDDGDGSFKDFLSYISSGKDSAKVNADREEFSKEDLAKAKTDEKEVVNVTRCNAIEVTECGVPEVNGRYRRFGKRDGTPAFSKIGEYEGREVMFTLGRWRSNGGTRKWYIACAVPGGGSGDRSRRLAFYVAYSPTLAGDPPRNGWMAVEDNELFLSPGYEGKGVRPAPALVLESDDASVAGSRSMSVRISNAMGSASRALGTSSGRKSRGGSRRSLRSSMQSLDSLSTKGSVRDKGLVPASVYLPPSLLNY